MFVRRPLPIDPKVTAFLARELRELRKLAQDRRAASLAVLRRGLRQVVPTAPRATARLPLSAS